MSTWIVLQPNGDGFHMVARTEASTAIGAIERTATGEGDYIAVPESRFRTMRVEPVQKFAVVPQKEQTA